MSPALLVAVALAATHVPAAAPAHRGAWPVRPPVVIGEFHPPSVRWGSGHRGIDLAASPGTPVVAAAAGIVTFAGALAGRGVVVIGHGALRSTYEPLTARVRPGQQVAAGQVIGLVAHGTPHCDPCLHWGLVRGSAYLDPRVLLGGRAVLKP